MMSSWVYYVHFRVTIFSTYDGFTQMSPHHISGKICVSLLRFSVLFFSEVFCFHVFPGCSRVEAFLVLPLQTQIQH